MLLCALCTQARAQQISPLGSKPEWNWLDAFQRTITLEEFESALETIYTDGESWKSTIKIQPAAASIRRMGENDSFYRLEFLPIGEEPANRPRRFWRKASELPPLAPEAPILTGLKIAIDPGHIGGEWASMEERSFIVGQAMPIQEGDLTLFVANLLAPRLESLGAEVTLVRENNQPVTEQRPHTMESRARLLLRSKGITTPERDYADPEDPERIFSIRWQAEKLFYRTSEIRARARKINDRIQPDIVLCLHFNAEPWGDPTTPELVETNHLHVLVNGGYSLGELAHDDTRFEMLERLLAGIHIEEIALAEAVAPALAKTTGLPPYIYPGDNARSVSSNPYIYARNLLANRLYSCPVMYLEPFVMNNLDVHRRLAKGYFVGRTLVGDKLHKSIYREYVEGVIDGLVAYYEANRIRLDDNGAPARRNSPGYSENRQPANLPLGIDVSRQ